MIASEIRPGDVIDIATTVTVRVLDTERLASGDIKIWYGSTQCFGHHVIAAECEVIVTRRRPLTICHVCPGDGVIFRRIYRRSCGIQYRPEWCTCRTGRRLAQAQQQRNQANA